MTSVRVERRPRRWLAPIAVISLSVILGACTDDPSGELTGPAALGSELAQSYNCTSCHSTDGSTGTGPTWRGIWGEEVELADGQRAVVDDDYIRRSISEPSAQVVDGFSPIMPVFDLDDDELAALSAYIRSLSEDD